jgi:putative ATP-grasp target RiPP
MTVPALTTQARHYVGPDRPVVGGWRESGIRAGSLRPFWQGWKTNGFPRLRPDSTNDARPLMSADPRGQPGNEKEVHMTRALVPYGVRHASTVCGDLVDLSALVYDPVRQVNYVREGSAIVPALRHSTGKTSTTTASSDARPGNDYDDDYTED